MKLEINYPILSYPPYPIHGDIASAYLDQGYEIIASYHIVCHTAAGCEYAYEIGDAKQPVPDISPVWTIRPTTMLLAPSQGGRFDCVSRKFRPTKLC